MIEYDDTEGVEIEITIDRALLGWICCSAVACWAHFPQVRVVLILLASPLRRPWAG